MQSITPLSDFFADDSLLYIKLNTNKTSPYSKKTLTLSGKGNTPDKSNLIQANVTSSTSCLTSKENS